MSAGPIKQERDGHKVAPVSTTAKDRVCASGGPHGITSHGYCGRSSAPRVDDWSEVTCTDCHAARRADEAAKAGA